MVSKTVHALKDKREGLGCREDGINRKIMVSKRGEGVKGVDEVIKNKDGCFKGRERISEVSERDMVTHVERITPAAGRIYSKAARMHQRQR